MHAAIKSGDGRARQNYPSLGGRNGGELLPVAGLEKKLPSEAA